MTAPNIDEIGKISHVEGVSNQNSGSTKIGVSETIDTIYKDKAKTNPDPKAVAEVAKNGAALLEAALEGESVIDSEIKRLGDEIRADMASKKPNWSMIDTKIRQLAILLLRKAGRTEQEISQEEIERMREDIKNVVGTYNNLWSLAVAIGAGTISVIGGLVGIGGGIAGIGQLANGAAKVSQTVQSVTQMSNMASGLSQGISTAIGGPLNSRYESKRAHHNFELEHDRTKKDAALQAAQQNRSMMAQYLSNLDRANEAAHTAMMRVLSSAAS
jgi:hypothetical protein